MKYLQLTPSDKLPDLSGFRPCKVVVIAEMAVDADQQSRISQWLVDSGCLYMMAWGSDSTSWEESVQLANRKAFDTPEIPDQSLIITTGHEEEPLKDVFWFGKYTATHACFKLENLLILHLANIERELELSAEYAAA
jgi:hypothetical protein